MRLDKIHKNLSAKIKFSGQNAPEAEVYFGKITDFFKGPFTEFLKRTNPDNPDEEIKQVTDALEYIEKITDQHLTEAEQCQVSPLTVVDGKVDIQPGCIIHRRNADMETIKTISQSAFLASEWFGIPESQDEGLFCTFLTRLIDQNDPSIHRFRKQYHQDVYLAKPQQITFYFDQNNPLMQKLTRLDYFEYARRVLEAPEEIQDVYSAEEINMFEKLIYPVSPCGREFHRKEQVLYYADWIAVPGAVPCELVNGISIHTDNKTLMDNIEEISKMYPNATIFDQEGKVLRTAKILDDEQENEL